MIKTDYVCELMAKALKKLKKIFLSDAPKFCLLLSPLILSGCLFSTPDSRFYLLEIPAENPVISTKKLNIAVQDVTVPAYLDRPQIVLQRPDSPELKISEFDRWASDLNTMLQNIMVDDLQKALPNAIIKRLSYGTTPQYIIKLNVERLGGWLGEEAYFKGSWQILTPAGRLLFEQNLNEQRDIGKTYASFVEAISAMLSTTTREIAQTIVAM